MASSFGTPPGYEDRRQAVIGWWMELSRSGDAGCSSWEVLDPIQNQVTEALAAGPPGLQMAEHHTARALLLWSGQVGD